MFILAVIHIYFRITYLIKDKSEEDTIEIGKHFIDKTEQNEVDKLLLKTWLVAD
jgi:hypothetical protein